MEEQPCIDVKGHDWSFVGYMVVSKELPEGEKVPLKRLQSGTSGPYPLLKVPLHFEAKIEVWQCDNCGWVQFKPAVFTRL